MFDANPRGHDPKNKDLDDFGIFADLDGNETRFFNSVRPDKPHKLVPEFPNVGSFKYSMGPCGASIYCVGFFALCPIVEGMEMLIDYGKDYNWDTAS
jgi:hypothetical protein